MHFDLTTEEGRKAFDEYRFAFIAKANIEHQDRKSNGPKLVEELIDIFRYRRYSDDF